MAGAQPIEPAGASLVERLRAVHLEMVDAVLGGDGLGRVAQLAADAAGAGVAIVVPRLGAAAASRGAPADLTALRRYVGDRARDRPRRGPGRACSPRSRSRPATRRSAAC